MLQQRFRTIAAVAALTLAVAVAGGGARAETILTGNVFADFTSKENKDQGTGGKSSDSGIGADVKRFFFTVTNEFNSVWSAVFQTDIGDQGARRYDVFVKRAYIQARLAPEAIFRLGSASNPWVPYVDDLYGYRYVQQVLIDRLNFGASTDWGVHFLGQAAGKSVNYAVGVVNGRTSSNPARSKSVDFEGRFGVQFSGLNVGVGGYSGKRGLDTKNVPALHTATRGDALVAYVGDNLRLGAEYFQAKNWNNVTTVATDKADGYAAWGSLGFAGPFGVFARYDEAKPSKTLHPTEKDRYYNVGLQWRPNKAFAAALVYKHEEIKNGAFTTTEGTIGSATPGAKGEYREIGVFTNYTF